MSKHKLHFGVKDTFASPPHARSPLESRPTCILPRQHDLREIIWWHTRDMSFLDIWPAVRVVSSTNTHNRKPKVFYPQGKPIIKKVNLQLSQSPGFKKNFCLKVQGLTSWRKNKGIFFRGGSPFCLLFTSSKTTSQLPKIIMPIILT